MGRTTGNDPGLYGIFFNPSFAGTPADSLTYLNGVTPDQRTLSTYSPSVNQPFFIGDGLDHNNKLGGVATGNPQIFNIPAGATELLLGIGPDNNLSDNGGPGYDVRIFDNGPANQSATATVVVNSPNVAVTKTADASTVTAGGQAGFTVTLTNTGLGQANGLTLTDALPALGGTNVWSISGGANAGSFAITGAAGSQQLTLSGVSTLAAGASLTVHITGTTTSSSSPVTLANAATVDAGNEATHNQSATATITVQATAPGANVAVTETADASTVTAGDQAGFTVTLTNTGLGQANGLTLTDALPALGGTNVWSISGGANSGSFAITGAVGSQQLAVSGVSTLAVGASLTVHISGTTTPSAAPFTATVSNNATVDASNEAAHNQFATATVLVNSPNVTVTNTADAVSVTPGSQAGFTVTLTNTGSGQANGLTLTDALPPAWRHKRVEHQWRANAGSFAITGPAGSQQLALSGISTLAASRVVDGAHHRHCINQLV